MDHWGSLGVHAQFLIIGLILQKFGFKLKAVRTSPGLEDFTSPKCKKKKKKLQQPGSKPKRIRVGRTKHKVITFAEVLNSLRHLKAGKAPGKDGLHAEFYMHLGPLALKWLHVSIWRSYSLTAGPTTSLLHFSPPDLWTCHPR